MALLQFTPSYWLCNPNAGSASSWADGHLWWHESCPKDTQPSEVEGALETVHLPPLLSRLKKMKEVGQPIQQKNEQSVKKLQMANKHMHVFNFILNI